MSFIFISAKPFCLLFPRSARYQQDLVFKYTHISLSFLFKMIQLGTVPFCNIFQLPLRGIFAALKGRWILATPQWKSQEVSSLQP